jgi:hypothetical protein
MYRFLLTLTATAAILTTASLMPNGAAASPVGQRADIAKTYKQADGLNGLDQCQFHGEYGQDLRERRERVEQERRERRERVEQERRERRERVEQERRERRERLEHERHEPH